MSCSRFLKESTENFYIFHFTTEKLVISYKWVKRKSKMALKITLLIIKTLSET